MTSRRSPSARIQAREHGRDVHDVPEPEQAEDGKPDQHHGTEDAADRLGALVLKPEQPAKDDAGDRTRRRG